MIWGIFYQRLSGGWIIPLWLFFFMYARTRSMGKAVPQAQAESALIGWWLGHTVPALAMLIPNQPSLCAVPIWVAFPILMSIFQTLWLWLRTRGLPHYLRASESESGHFALQLTYASAMIASLIGQVHVVLIPALRAASSYAPTKNVVFDKDLGLFETLISFFFAPFGGPAFGLLPTSPSETTAASGVMHFVQCDVLVVFSAVWVALLWDLSMRRGASRKQDMVCWLFKMVCALALGGFILSPGAATGALMMYREDYMKNVREDRDDIAAKLLENARLQRPTGKPSARANSL